MSGRLSSAVDMNALNGLRLHRRATRRFASEVFDVDVIADTGAVGRGVVVAVDCHLLSQPERGLAGDADQVRRHAA